MTTAGTMPLPPPNEEGPEKKADLGYMHKPPLIMPNYGKKKKSRLPKSNVSRVLLYDNVTQKQMLDVKLSHIKVEKSRSSRLLEMHRRSFVSRQKKRARQLQDASVGSTSQRPDSFLPSISNGSDSKERKGGTSRGNSEYSNRNGFNSSRGGRYSAFSKFSFNIDDLKLPDISDHKRHVIFKLQDEEGNTQIYHTYDDDGGMLSEFIPMSAFYTKTTDDPRFLGLEEALVRSNEPSEGYNELSPSYHREYASLPEHLLTLSVSSQGPTVTEEGSTLGAASQDQNETKGETQ